MQVSLAANRYKPENHAKLQMRTEKKHFDNKLASPIE